jgi:hypothetical protein
MGGVPPPSPQVVLESQMRSGTLAWGELVVKPVEMLTIWITRPYGMFLLQGAVRLTGSGNTVRNRPLGGPERGYRCSRRRSLEELAKSVRVFLIEDSSVMLATATNLQRC